MKQHAIAVRSGIQASRVRSDQVFWIDMIDD